MKKILAILTALVMALMSMSVVLADETSSVATDSDKTWRAICKDGNETNSISGSDTIGIQGKNGSPVTGIGQKSSDDSCTKLDFTAAQSTKYGNFKLLPYYRYKNPTTEGSSWSVDSKRKYVVIGIDFYLDSTAPTQVDSVEIARESGYLVTDRIDISSLKKDIWHNVYFVLDMSGISNKTTAYKCYIDGALAKNGKYTDSVDIYTSFPTDFRIQLYNNKILHTEVDNATFIKYNYEYRMYIDNFELFMTDVNPIGTISSYSNNFNSRDTNGLTFSALGAASYVTAVAGKSETDYSAMSNTTGSSASILQYTSMKPQRAYTKLDFNLYLPEGTGITQLSLQTGWSINIDNTTISADKFTKNRWNHVTYIIHDLDSTFTNNYKKNVSGMDIY